MVGPMYALNTVVTVRDKTVVPAQRLVGYVVAGLCILFLVGAVGILAAVGVFRLVDVYLPGGAWAAYLVFGGIFVVAGMFCWARRTKVSPPE